VLPLTVNASAVPSAKLTVGDDKVSPVPRVNWILLFVCSGIVGFSLKVGVEGVPVRAVEVICRVERAGVDIVTWRVSDRDFDIRNVDSNTEIVMKLEGWVLSGLRIPPNATTN
jgi:hypothetical protein